MKPDVTGGVQLNPRTSPDRVSHEDIARKMRLDYSYAKSDRNLRVMDAVQGLFSHLQTHQVDTRSLVHDAASLVSKHFSIREVAIGLKSPTDGRYRYEVLIGYRKESEEAHQRLSYSFDEMYDEAKYKGTVISKYTRLFLAEDEPYVPGEEMTYSRPIMLKLRRKSLEDSIEGDYLDTNIYGTNDELLGWIEISGTTVWRLPDIATIKWIEVVACIIGAALSPRFSTGKISSDSQKSRDAVQG